MLAASSGRALDTAYRNFLALVARQTAALVNGAIAYQAQLRRAEELAELDRAKTTFFSNISHEFRTPLTLIMGPVEELQRRLGQADEATRAELDVIHRNGLRLGKLVNSLLDFSRIEAGRMQARYEPVDLSAFTAELASVFRSAIERAGLRYEVDCPALSAPVDVDREMWEKIVLNLLSNALKFTFDGHIAVSLAEKDGQAVLRVADTGSGIPAAELPAPVRPLPPRPERAGAVQRGQRYRPRPGARAGRAAPGNDQRRQHGTRGHRLHRAPPVQPPGRRTPCPRRHRGARRQATTPPCCSSADPYVQEAMRWLPSGDDGPADPGTAAPVSAPTRGTGRGGHGRAPRPARRRQLRHARVPPAAAAARLPGDHGHRRAGRARLRQVPPA